VNDEIIYELVKELLETAAPDAHARIFEADEEHDEEAAEEQERLFGIVRGYMETFEEHVIDEARSRL
jgi:hypothetical protein